MCLGHDMNIVSLIYIIVLAFFDVLLFLESYNYLILQIKMMCFKNYSFILTFLRNSGFLV